MTAVPSGASGRSTVQRWSKNAPPASHSNRTRASPGHGGPPGGQAAIVHSPTKRSSAWSMVRTVAADPTHRDHGGTVYHRSSRQHLDRSPTETGGANHRVIAAVP